VNGCKILFLRSRRPKSGEKPHNDYVQEFGGIYADKVIGNLKNEPGFCTSCGPDCTNCRHAYNRDFARNIAGIIAFPAILPYLLETPADYLPPDVPRHDVLLAVNIHEQILLEFVRRCRRWGTRGIVVPIEASDWISGSARSEATALCEKQGIEIAFPKPFCSFAPPAGTLLARFREEFHVGKPRVRLEVKNDRVSKAFVEVSAACGATYYVARWLEGRHITDDLEHDVVARRFHSYPCTASMKWDDEIAETPLHLAGEAHCEILDPLKNRPRQEESMVKSPVGTMVLRPVPLQENLANIEKAKQAILDNLAACKQVSLQSLRSERNISPAAANSALLLLKQEGKVRVEGSRILPA